MANEKVSKSNGQISLEQKADDLRAVIALLAASSPMLARKKANLSEVEAVLAGLVSK